MKNGILIVDDDEDIAEAMELILADAGYKVEINKDASNILGKIASERPKLVLLDVLMSGIDGRDICAAVKNDPILRDTAVVMISAHPTAQASIKQYGADYFLPKPFESEDLVRIVKRYAG